MKHRRTALVWTAALFVSGLTVGVASAAETTPGRASDPDAAASGRVTAPPTTVPGSAPATPAAPAAPAEPDRPAEAAQTPGDELHAAGDAASRRPGERASFEATIVTGDRSRRFDSPARALSELQRAVGLQRRSGREQRIAFRAVLAVNGEEFEFDDPDEARDAVRAVIDAVRRLAKVRAALGDLGAIPDLEPEDPDGPERDERTAARSRPDAQTAMATIRQRVNQALREELQRNQGRPLSPQRTQQIYADEWSRARSEGLVADAVADGRASRPATAAAAAVALEARKAAEIEAVRELLGRAFSTASTDSEPEGE